ncbi:unnamed protein product [Notodromas monacha]|uniref:Uncharacterized protein n=1 Tax=Notodromas monacha TaxID=399045 RepID=A0A7R9BSC4_9CRUS|nr:unnamed protein product [Notodromas monacha]CAG0920482.1 unnamed protein product [Notodromas monacha]
MDLSPENRFRKFMDLKMPAAIKATLDPILSFYVHLKLDQISALANRQIIRSSFKKYVIRKTLFLGEMNSKKKLWKPEQYENACNRCPAYVAFGYASKIADGPEAGYRKDK